MTFAATAPMRLLFSEPPFLPFWAWSGLLHLGLVALFSVMQVMSHIEDTPSVVKVTLIETPAPSAGPSQPEKQESAPQPPHMLNAQRSATPTPPQPIKIPEPLTMPTVPLTMAQMAIPQKPREQTLPIERPPLRDDRADNQVELKNYLKVAQRTPVSRSSSHSRPLQLDASSSATQPPTHIPTPTFAPSTARASQSASRPLTPNILKAMAPGVGVISKSKVGLGRTIPPVYPRIARESGWEGTVVVRVAVQPDGYPERIEVRKSSGHTVLDKAAVEAVKKWKFSPAKDGNIPIRSIVEIPINFDLRKQG